MPVYNTITGEGTPPPADDGSYEVITVYEDPPLQAPDPQDLYGHPSDEYNTVGGGGGGGGNPIFDPPPPPPENPPPPEPLTVDHQGNELSPEAKSRYEQAARLEELAKQGIVLPEKMPPGVDLAENMRLAREHQDDPNWFYSMVKDGGPWDYKKQGKEYEDFGNFNFGVVGRAMGIPENVLLRGAGVVQQDSGTSDPAYGNPTDFNNGPYGDDPVDQFYIRQGSRLFETNGSGQVPDAN